MHEFGVGCVTTYAAFSIYIGSKYAFRVYQRSRKPVTVPNQPIDDVIIDSIFCKTGAILGAFIGGVGVAASWPLIAVLDNLENQGKQLQ